MLATRDLHDIVMLFLLSRDSTNECAKPNAPRFQGLPYRKCSAKRLGRRAIRYAAGCDAGCAPLWSQSRKRSTFSHCMALSRCRCSRTINGFNRICISTHGRKMHRQRIRIEKDGRIWHIGVLHRPLRTPVFEMQPAAGGQ